jgi:hypothetical protein
LRTDERIRLLCGVRVAMGALFVLLGLTVF